LEIAVTLLLEQGQPNKYWRACWEDTFRHVFNDFSKHKQKTVLCRGKHLSVYNKTVLESLKHGQPLVIVWPHSQPITTIKPTREGSRLLLKNIGASDLCFSSIIMPNFKVFYFISFYSFIFLFPSVRLSASYLYNLLSPDNRLSPSFYDLCRTRAQKGK